MQIPANSKNHWFLGATGGKEIVSVGSVANSQHLVNEILASTPLTQVSVARMVKRSPEKDRTMKRLAITLAVGSLSCLSSPAFAAPVSVRANDGTVWVMQIEPAGAPVAPVESGDAPMPIVEPAKPIDIKPPVDMPSEPESPAAPVTEELAPAAPVDQPAVVEPAAVATPQEAIEPAAYPIEKHGMMIIPRGCETDGDLKQRYLQIYNSIPFNRAEYVANPAYRHDATMELLTGQPRPTAGYTGKTVRNREYTGYRPYLPSSTDYYRYRYPFGYGGLYGYGRLPFMGLGF